MCCARHQTGVMRVRSVTWFCKFKLIHINRANAKRARCQRFDTGCALQINHSGPAAVCGKLPRDCAGPDAASPPLKFISDSLPTHVRKAALISGTESGFDFSTAGQLVAKIYIGKSSDACPKNGLDFRYGKRPRFQPRIFLSLVRFLDPNSRPDSGREIVARFRPHI